MADALPWSPLKNGFLSGKYCRGTEVTDSARTAFVGGPTHAEFVVIDAVAAIADDLATTSAAVALAWLRARSGTVVPILCARRVEHLTDNITGLEVTLSPEHLRTLDEVSAPTLNYPAPMHGEQRAMLQFAGATVDGKSPRVSTAAAERRPNPAG
ncbi:aldo/keto reductase [Rhodococcus sp. WB9]|nr:aldo/keto reductase [Rhodococcus sp. WB9]